MRQQRMQELQSFTGTPGTAQALVFNIQNLPKDLRVTSFALYQDYVFTNDGNTARRNDVIVGLTLSMVQISSEFYKARGTGFGFDRLYRAMNGKAISSAAKGGGAAVNSLRAVTILPLSDARAVSPHDTAIPTEILNGNSIEVTTTGIALNAATLFGGAAAGTVSYRLYANFTDGAGAVDPTATRIDFEDWGGQTALLKPGAYTHLFSYKETGANTTPAELERLTFNIDGDPVLQNILAWAAVIEYNRVHVSGGFEDNNTEQLASDTAGYPFLPWYTPPSDYKFSGVPQTDKPNVTAQFTGTATTQRFMYRQAVWKNESMVASAAQAFGKSPETVTRVLKTASKTAVAAGKTAERDIAKRKAVSRLIPGRLNG